MAAPPRFRGFSRESFPDAPEWFEPFLIALNEVLAQTVLALDGRLVRGQNLSGGKRSVKFRTKATVDDTFPFPFETGLSGPIGDMWTGKLEKTESGSPPVSGVSITWRNAGAGRAELLSVMGLEPNTEYRLSLLME